MTTETTTAAALLDAQEMPATAPSPTPPAPVTPAPSPAPADETPAPAPAEKDSLGRAFDARKFAPRKDTRGRWVNKNAGRKPRHPQAAETSGKSFVAPDEPPPAPAPAPGAAVLPGKDRFDLAAEMYCRSGYALLDMLFLAEGEWFPTSPSEHESLTTATAAYLRHKQCEDLPPGMIFALAIGGYAAPRLAKPRTRAAIAGLLGRGKRPAVPAGAPAPLPPEPPAPTQPADPAPMTAPEHETTDTIHDATTDHLAQL